MTDRPRFIAAERFDLKDLQKLCRSSFEEDQFKFLKIFLGIEPGGSVLDGFRIAVPATGTARIQVINGFAIDRFADLVYKADEVSLYPNILFENPTLVKEVILADGTWKIEVEYVWSDGGLDARAMFDPTYDNGLNCCGDEKPDGKEVPFDFNARDFPEWNVRVKESTLNDWTYKSDYFSPSFPTIYIPIAIINVAGGAVTSLTEPANSTVTRLLESAPPYRNLIVNSARYFSQVNSVELYYESDGVVTPILNGATNVWPISKIDYNNNAIEIGADIAVTPKIIKAIAGSTAALRLIKENLGSNVISDFRRIFYSRLVEVPDLLEAKQIIQDPIGYRSFEANFDNWSGVAGPLNYALREPSIRNPHRIKDFVSLLKALQLVILEMKYGVTSSFAKVKEESGSDTEYNRENWVNLTPKASQSHSDDLAPGTMGSLDEVAQARVRLPQYREPSRQFFNDTLKGRLEADRVYNITIGDGVNSQGDFWGARGFVNAIHYINDTNLANCVGVIHVKEGNYDLSTIVISDPLIIPKGWSLVGDGSNKTFVRTNDRTIQINCGNLSASDYKTFGQRIQGITFCETSVRDESLLRIWVNTDEAKIDLQNYLVENLLELHDVCFISEDGANSLESYGMLTISSHPSSTYNRNFSRGILIDNCKWFCRGDAGKRWIHLDEEDNISNIRNVKIRNCNFRCESNTLYGIKIFASNTNENFNDLISIENCVFSGMGYQATFPECCCIQLGGYTSNKNYRSNLHVTGCKFYGALDNSNLNTSGSNAIARKGFGIGSYSNPSSSDGKSSFNVRIKSCDFFDVQVGVHAQHGNVEVIGCSFQNCSVGVFPGDISNVGTLTNRVRLFVKSCVFNGALTDFDQDDSGSPDYVEEATLTVGVCLARVFPSSLIGFRSEKMMYTLGGSVDITDCDFNSIGIAIDLSLLATKTTVYTYSDQHSWYQNVSISNSRFRNIAANVVNAINVDPVQISGMVVSVVDRFTFTGNTVQGAMFVARNGMMTNASYPASEISQLCQYAINLAGFRNVISNNTIDQIGDNGYPTSTHAIVTSTGKFFIKNHINDCKFLAVIGNEQKQGCFSVVIKGNTITNFNNLRQQSYYPWGFPVGESGAKRQGCWAAVILFCDGGISANYSTGTYSNGVTCDISDNIISGEYANFGSSFSESAGGKFNNGFYVGARDIGPIPPADLKSVGCLSFKGNKIITNNGQFHLYVDWSPVLFNDYYKLGWKQILIQGNECRNFNSNVTDDNPWPLSGVGLAGTKINLIHIEGYLSGNPDSVYRHGEQNINELLQNSQSGILIRDNTFECVGDVNSLESRKIVNSDNSRKIGVLITKVHGKYGSDSHLQRRCGVIVHCSENQFLGCQYAFVPGDLETDTIWHLHVCENNLFVGGARNGTFNGGSSSGFFRGIAYLKVTGFVSNSPSDAVTDDEGSITKFCGNTIINGTCMVRFVPGVHWGGMVPVLSEKSCSYHIELSNNMFKGKGAGTGDPLSSGTYYAFVRSQFDFIGGFNKNSTQANLSPFSQWSNLDLGDLFNIDNTQFENPRPITWGNKSIKVVNNHFSGEVGDGSSINFLSFPYGVDPAGALTELSVADLRNLTTFAADGCSFMVAGNMICDANAESIYANGTLSAYHFSANGASTA